MSISSKRLLSTLSAMSAVALTASSVVACRGFDLSQIISRERATNEYVLTYQYPVQSWNSSYTFKVYDHRVLANTNATPLGVDEYGRVYGDIFAPNDDVKSETVGKKIDEQTWNYKIRSSLHWYSYDGTKLGDITEKDFQSAAEFILKAKTTQSQLFNLWVSFIVGAKEMYTYFNSDASKGKYSWEDGLSAVRKGFSYTGSDGKKVEVKGVSEGFGLDTSKSGEITYHLTKPAPYFESLLCYAVFSPLFLKNGETVEQVGRVDDFKNGRYSGAYLPKNVTGDEMVLQKNENYWFSDMVSIKSIKYVNTSANTSTKDREFFESGSTSGFSLASDDNVGWSRYVGSNIDEPSFDYIYDVTTSDSLYTRTLFFNMYNSDIDAGGDESVRAAKASKLLQNKLARAFISTGLDRSVFVKFFSDKFDGGSSVSKMLRNVYTAPGVAQDNSGKDYSSYVEDSVKNLDSVKKSGVSLQLADGNDALKDNVKVYTGEDQASIISKLRTYMKDEHILGDGESTFEIRTIQNPDENHGANPLMNQMFDRFNAIPDNPIKIVSISGSTKEDFQEKENKGQFDFDIAGWGPDYADPGTYLNTTRINGDMNTFTGSAKIMNVLSSGSGQKYDSLFAKSSDVSKNYMDSYKVYDEAVGKTDVDASGSERYKQFADEEASYIYENFFIMPFYKRAAPKNYTVSYVLPYTSNYAWSYGIAGYKDWSKILSNKIVSKQEAETQKLRVEEYAKQISQSSTHKKDDENDRNYILFKK
ncbi:oligopeptide ABC transporter substrate-binding protein [Spiroplasma helicoides]|uniref:Oligopeptide ABC transporter substrate-binding protein n=1 Tax=Spiroplasma helicoides TaxID=216938 RepID=A0A1B3SKL6_9MOLU|nr:ABC transporter substrate-binding protein [Spiroplasma helicoides]AOG60455.1 oligopeptide ABC transporter substrate-binding protein [Spiroplasma helicoides]